MKDSWAPIYLDKNEKFEFIDELITGKIPALILKKAFSLNLCKKITEKILDFNHISSGPGNAVFTVIDICKEYYTC